MNLLLQTGKGQRKSVEPQSSPRQTTKDAKKISAGLREFLRDLRGRYLAIFAVTFLFVRVCTRVRRVTSRRRAKAKKKAFTRKVRQGGPQRTPRRSPRDCVSLFAIFAALFSDLC